MEINYRASWAIWLTSGLMDILSAVREGTTWEGNRGQGDWGSRPGVPESNLSKFFPSILLTSVILFFCRFLQALTLTIYIQINVLFNWVIILKNTFDYTWIIKATQQAMLSGLQSFSGLTMWPAVSPTCPLQTPEITLSQSWWQWSDAELQQIPGYQISWGCMSSWQIQNVIEIHGMCLNH